MEAIRSEYLLPNLQNPPQNFTQMTKYIVNGLQCFNPFDPYTEIIFMIKRLSGVPNYHYLESEIPVNYDRNNLQIYKESRFDRIFIWLSVKSRQYLLKCFIFRWIFNILTLIGEFFIRFFPFLAFFKFGCRNAYVNIQWGGTARIVSK